MFVILLQGLKIKVSTRSDEPKPADRIQNHHREAFASPCLGTVFKCHRAFRAARGGREEAGKVRAAPGNASAFPRGIAGRPKDRLPADPNAVSDAGAACTYAERERRRGSSACSARFLASGRGR
jgi:hypothetical protein